MINLTNKIAIGIITPEGSSNWMKGRDLFKGFA
jgi:hypothetical protein